MKKLALLVSVVIIASAAFADVASAQQASVFGNGVLVSAYVGSGECSVAGAPAEPAVSCMSDMDCDVGQTCTNYSASLEVRDEAGLILDPSEFSVTGVSPTATPDVSVNPFLIHPHNLMNNDISLSYNSGNKTIYVFCTDGTIADPNLHVMMYHIGLNNPVPDPVSGQCGSANNSTFYTAPSTNLCDVTNDTPVVTGSGPWNWNCTGIDGGGNVNCLAYKKVDGVCGSSNGGTFPSAPTTNLCNVTYNTPGVSGSGPWTWSCTGTNGGSTAPCSASIQSSNPADLAFKTSYGYILGIMGPKAGYNNVPFYENVTINNYGTGNAGSFAVKMWITSLAPTSSSSTHCNLGADAELLYTWNVSGLSAGQSRTQQFSPLQVSGKSIHTTYYICTEIDTGEPGF